MLLKQKKTKKKSIKKYNLRERKLIETHLIKYFGESSYVIHEIESLDIHLDIYIIEPTEKKDFYTLITIGMGASKMNVPKSCIRNKLNRAELIITLPKSWKIDYNNGKWYWPILLLKDLGRLPIHSNTWLGYSHTISNQIQYDKTTKLSGAFLSFPFTAKENIKSLHSKIGLFKNVNFYQVVPIYEEEMNYKIKNGVEKFEELFPTNFDMIINPKRNNFAKK